MEIIESETNSTIGLAINSFTDSGYGMAIPTNNRIKKWNRYIGSVCEPMRIRYRPIIFLGLSVLCNL